MGEAKKMRKYKANKSEVSACYLSSKPQTIVIQTSQPTQVLQRN